MKKNVTVICALILGALFLQNDLVVEGAKKMMEVFVDQDQVINAFQISDIDVDISEEFAPPSQWDGSEWEKLVKVQNNSTGPALIRVSIQKRWEDKQGNPWAGNINFINLQFSREDLWVDGTDGYFYYNQIIDTGQFTKILLESVSLSIPENQKSLYADKRVKIEVDVEAVQATSEGYQAVWKNLTAEVTQMLEGLCNQN